ncbi:TIGR03087 family PEP-CTERM/XrtA system glycosyltransferase [Aliiglaciecola sp. 2_MG-2023]|uniref:TIGR03087 family PEP-CTERM/XrtA system glycosyltransferase n=1 Tax=unclassified Aliiglaciecola TaxID=2593648 RepID=UPI0026E39329|nr:MULTISPECIES: TIGR03087 family PEP-CTERM/XrtA system glycosyltransferase [unclassified Aliiglaciecola]MDO6709178.1 TIGR03087 family PEP-CTERM/XrtA system glycosyltransferase [Aliiglaciecola sp. 2_MG-2023]MDO6750326.1 TIGR03087 family PEP-CTERM/XrtA system glycosyltransferase [Aliiglaciecola sp. 1_MG-2023]
MTKPPLLFLCHRIPFPPNKGDKIRSFNMLKVLSEQFDIYLGSFVDDPYDWQYASKLDKYCKQVFLLGQNKTWAKVKGLTAFITGKSISEPYYANSKMQRWVNKTLDQQNITQVFIYSSVMAMYTSAHSKSIHQVVDYVDVDSDKWRQYAENKSGIAKWVYHREHHKLQAFETRVCERSQCALFVSDPEADLFKQQLADTQFNKVQGLLNGVDVEYFSPDSEMEPISLNVDVVFTGAMDYWANVDAVIWFVNHVWPSVRRRYPKASFYVVGGNPTAQILSLNNTDGIVVTGRVKDVRPFIRLAKVSVAPLQIARGIQNKVLEALAMAKPVVATNMAIEGIDAKNAHIKVTDDAELFCSAVCDYLDSKTEVPESRQWIMENLQWTATMGKLPALFKV